MTQLGEQLKDDIRKSEALTLRLIAADMLGLAAGIAGMDSGGRLNPLGERLTSWGKDVLRIAMRMEAEAGRHTNGSEHDG